MKLSIAFFLASLVTANAITNSTVVEKPVLQDEAKMHPEIIWALEESLGGMFTEDLTGAKINNQYIADSLQKKAEKSGKTKQDIDKALAEYWSKLKPHVEVIKDKKSTNIEIPKSINMGQALEEVAEGLVDPMLPIIKEIQQIQNSPGVEVITTEDKVLPDGLKIHKETHQQEGVEFVEITSNKPIPLNDIAHEMIGDASSDLALPLDISTPKPQKISDDTTKAKESDELIQNEEAPKNKIMMVFFGGLTLIIFLLLWFVFTCKNKSREKEGQKDRFAYETVNNKDDQNEMGNIQPQSQRSYDDLTKKRFEDNFGSLSDSDELEEAEDEENRIKLE